MDARKRAWENEATALACSRTTIDLTSLVLSILYLHFVGGEGKGLDSNRYAERESVGGGGWGLAAKRVELRQV